MPEPSMIDRVEIVLLGGFSVRVGDRTVRETDWSGRRPMELVQLLALRPARSEVRDRVLDTLWPHLEPVAAARNLHKAAHHARRVLGDPGAIVLRGGQVRLFPGATVDTDLDRWRAAAAAALRTGDAAACQAAADLVAGELLPGSLYEEWTVVEREEVRATLRRLLEAAGDWERLAALDPTDEHAHEQLMRAALDAGRWSEVVERFETLRSALGAELGVRPGDETTALYEAAIAGHVDAGRDLVGRDRELAVVDAATRVPEQRAGLVAVHGPAGIGKSAFCRQLAADLEARGWARRWTDPAGHHRPFGPLVRVVDEVLLDPRRVWPDLPPPVRSVLASLSELAPEAPPVPGPLTRHQVLGAVTAALRALAGPCGTVLVLDDAHVADQGTLDVLLHLASSVPDVLVVLAFRPESATDELRDGLARLARSGHLLDVGLGALGPGAAAELVRNVTGGALADADVGRIVERAEGNPFALRELAQAGATGDELPPSVAAAIISRLVDLDDGVLDDLGLLALARDELDRDLVVALTGRSRADAAHLLDRLLEAEVLVVVGGRYRFRHDLVRDALRDRVPPHRRLDVHRAAAERLADRGAPPAVVAHHWLAAREPAEAVDWCLEAAAEAMALGAFRDARRHLEPVLRHDPRHREALRFEAECLDMLGDPGTLAAYDAAIAVADEDVADDLVIARALAQVKQGDPAGGLASMRGARPRSPVGRLNEALTYAGAAALGVVDPAIGTEKAHEVRRIALESGDAAGIVIAAWADAAAAHARGDLHDSVLRDLRETAELPVLAVRVFDGHLCMTQRFLYGSRPYDEVVSFAERLTAEAERLGALRGRAFGVTLRAEALFHSGHLDAAHAGFEEGLDLHRRTGGTTGEAHALQRLAELYHSAERPADARAAVDDALDLTRMSDIGFHLLDRVYGSRITVAIDPDEGLAAVEEAEAAVQGPLETCPGCRIHLAVPAAVASARAGDLDRAYRYADAVDFLADVVMRLPAWYAARDEVRGQLALACGDRDAARANFEQAARCFAGAGHPLDEQRCRASARAL